MTWFKVDDQLHDHKKVRKLGKEKPIAMGLWVLCGSWSAANLSDGFVPAEIVERIDPEHYYAKRLVEVGFWECAEEDGEQGYQFNDWSDYQPLRGEVEASRDSARERMRRLRSGNTGGNGSLDREANKQQTAAPRSSERSRDVRANKQRTDGERSSELRSNIEQTSSEVRDSFATCSRPPSRPVPTRIELSNESSGVPRKRGPTKQGTRIPEDFTATPQMVTWAHEECPLTDGRYETEQFIDYWRSKPGKDAEKVNWIATWRKWMRKAQNYAEERTGRSPPQGSMTGSRRMDKAFSALAPDDPLLAQLGDNTGYLQVIEGGMSA
ncbi:MAG: hypothetical protein ACREQ5_03960 [Candidatus Dormibacteria bacterium]